MSVSMENCKIVLYYFVHFDVFGKQTCNSLYSTVCMPVMYVLIIYLRVISCNAAIMIQPFYSNGVVFCSLHYVYHYVYIMFIMIMCDCIK